MYFGISGVFCIINSFVFFVIFVYLVDFVYFVYFALFIPCSYLLSLSVKHKHVRIRYASSLTSTYLACRGPLPQAPAALPCSRLVCASVLSNAWIEWIERQYDSTTVRVYIIYIKILKSQNPPNPQITKFTNITRLFNGN